MYMNVSVYRHAYMHAYIRTYILPETHKRLVVFLGRGLHVQLRRSAGAFRTELKGFYGLVTMPAPLASLPGASKQQTLQDVGP